SRASWPMLCWKRLSLTAQNSDTQQGPREFSQGRLVLRISLATTHCLIKPQPFQFSPMMHHANAAPVFSLPCRLQSPTLAPMPRYHRKIDHLFSPRGAIRFDVPDKSRPPNQGERFLRG